MASTTLVTFLLDVTKRENQRSTSPDVHCGSIPFPHSRVELLGSWDNFNTPYAMEKDSQRGHGHWFGCHSFKNIICDGDPGQDLRGREGGLRMGGTYWYYYKLDGDIEIHDSTHPSTTMCPLLPGQTVNLLEIPLEASVTTISDCMDVLFTMCPKDRYITPKRSTKKKRPSSSNYNALTKSKTFFAHTEWLHESIERLQTAFVEAIVTHSSTHIKRAFRREVKTTSSVTRLHSAPGSLSIAESASRKPRKAPIRDFHQSRLVQTRPSSVYGPCKLKNNIFDSHHSIIPLKISESVKHACISDNVTNHRLTNSSTMFNTPSARHASVEAERRIGVRSMTTQSCERSGTPLARARETITATENKDTVTTRNQTRAVRKQVTTKRNQEPLFQEWWLDQEAPGRLRDVPPGIEDHAHHFSVSHYSDDAASQPYLSEALSAYQSLRVSHRLTWTQKSKHNKTRVSSLGSNLHEIPKNRVLSSPSTSFVNFSHPTGEAFFNRECVWTPIPLPPSPESTSPTFGFLAIAREVQSPVSLSNSSPKDSWREASEPSNIGAGPRSQEAMKPVMLAVAKSELHDDFRLNLDGHLDRFRRIHINATATPDKFENPFIVTKPCYEEALVSERENQTNKRTSSDEAEGVADCSQLVKQQEEVQPPETEMGDGGLMEDLGYLGAFIV